MATLLEQEEHDDHDYDDEKRTIQTTKTSTFLSRTRTTNTNTNDDENALATIARELISDVLGRYMNEITRFAYIRKTSHSGAASRRRAKRPKDQASNQKKPRQGLTREDMRRAQEMVRGVSSVREERRRVIGDESFEYRRHIIV